MRKAFLIASSLLALLATTAAPASADGGGGHAATAANPLCESSFSSLRTLAGAGGTLGAHRGSPGGREPRLRTSGKLDKLGPEGQAAAGLPEETIPVFVHVVTAGAEGNVSDFAILNQMIVLNLAFAGFYGGLDTGFSFKLSGSPHGQRALVHAEPGEPGAKRR